MNKYDICGFDKEQELNNLHNKEYVNKQGVCPVCGESDLKYSPVYFNGENAIFEYHCNNCDCNGREIYYIEFTGHSFWDEEKEEEIDLC